MHRFYELEKENEVIPFVVSGELVELSNHEDTLRQAQGERDEEDDFYDDEDEEREWCD